MDFYYDPILGLQYTALGGYIIMDIDVIPSETSVDKILELIKQYGICVIEPYYNFESRFEITNYKV